MTRPPNRSDRGLTLLELAVAMALLGLCLTQALPAARRQMDLIAVRAARNELAGLFHQARDVAIARGGSEVVLSSQGPGAELLANGDTLTRVALAGYRVSMNLNRGQQVVRLAFGPLGLGLVTSQTIQFQKGRARALLVISSLGRVTRK